MNSLKIQVHKCCVQKLFFCFGIQNNICTQHVLNLYFSGNSMNNLLPCWRKNEGFWKRFTCMTSQFPEFLKSNFWQVFDIRPNCALGRVNGQKKVVLRALFFQLCECVCLWCAYVISACQKIVLVVGKFHGWVTFQVCSCS